MSLSGLYTLILIYCERLTAFDNWQTGLSTVILLITIGVAAMWSAKDVIFQISRHVLYKMYCFATYQPNDVGVVVKRHSIQFNTYQPLQFLHGKIVV